MNFSSASYAPGRERLPWPPDGFESYTLRRWRESVAERHAAAEGVPP